MGLKVSEIVLIQKAAERGGYGTERYEQLEFQRKVAQYYNMLRDPTWQVLLSSPCRKN